MVMNVFKFILKYRVLHVLFWILKLQLLVHELQSHKKTTSVLIYYDALIAVFFQALCVYLTIYLLVPRFFTRKKYLLFTVTLLSVILATAWADVWLQGHYMKWFFNPDHHPRYLISFIGHSIDSLIISLVFTLIVLIQYYYRREQKNKLLEKEKLETELNFLKAQVNPHFLFNALNSIYVLMEDDKQLAKSTLLKFSALLRYQLYDCSVELTTVEDEINFIRDYVDIEKIRNTNNLDVKLVLPAAVPYKLIAPLLLITFVENAFKHVSHFTGQTNSIRIEIVVSGNFLSLQVKNSYQEDISPVPESGIGLKNVKRRLELLYPSQHNLRVTQANNFFNVNLILTLHET